jgi:hypothetical protein
MRLTWILGLGVGLLATACGGDEGGSGSGGAGGGSACDPPSDGLWATFDVVGETFSSAITNAAGIQQAIDLWHGDSSASIPNGELRCDAVPYNCSWSFHQDPKTIQFAEITTEVCDGKPSYVEDHCASFGTNYCPWSAMLVDLRDCRTDPGCPPAP